MFTNPNSYIGRWVVLLSPVFLAISTGIVNLAQAKFGIDLDKDQLTILLSTTFLSTAGLIAVWLKNRGISEVVKSQQNHEISKEIVKKGGVSDPETGVDNGELTGPEVDLDEAPPVEVTDHAPKDSE